MSVPRITRVVRTVSLAGGVALVLLPVTFVVTFLLVPFWGWLEATTGIESLGHSGPSDWCFWLVYALLVASAALVARRLRHSGRAR